MLPSSVSATAVAWLLWVFSTAESIRSKQCFGDGDPGTVSIKVGVPHVVTFPEGKSRRFQMQQDNATTKFAFLVFEVHSHALPLLVSSDNASYSDPALDHGLVMVREGTTLQQEAFICNVNSDDAQGLVLVRGYQAQDPVPGMGQSQGNATAIVPEVQVAWTDYVTTIRFKEAGSLSIKPNGSAGTRDLVYNYDVYQYWFREGDFERDDYFDGLSSMLFKSDVEENGHKVGHFYLQKGVGGHVEATFSTLAGTAQLFAVVVTTESASNDGSGQATHHSVYVSGITAGCSMVAIPPSAGGGGGDTFPTWRCEEVYSVQTSAVIAVCALLAAFLLVAGHRCFSLSQIVFGTFLGSCAAYPLAAGFFPSSDVAVVLLPVCGGLLAGVLAYVLWKLFEAPPMSLAVPNLLTGALIGMVVVHMASLLQSQAMTTDAVFFGTCGAVAGAYVVVAVGLAKHAHIFACAMVGAFTVAVAMAQYLRSTVKFVLLNFLRRTFVSNYRLACCQLPFQDNEVIVLVFWLGMLVFSFALQSWQEKRRLRSSARPATTTINVSVQEETSPLLQSVDEGPFDGSVPSATPRDQRGMERREIVGYIQGYGAVTAPPSSLMQVYQDPLFYVDRDIRMSPSRPRPRESRRQQSSSSAGGCSDPSRTRDIFKPPDMDSRYSPT